MERENEGVGATAARCCGALSQGLQLHCPAFSTALVLLGRKSLSARVGGPKNRCTERRKRDVRVEKMERDGSELGGQRRASAQPRRWFQTRGMDGREYGGSNQ